MSASFSVNLVESTQLASLNSRQDRYEIQLVRSGEEDSLFQDLLVAFDELAAKLTSGLDPENDRLGLSMLHDDLVAKSIDVPLQRPKNLTGQTLLTHFGKVVQSQESLGRQNGSACFYS